MGPLSAVALAITLFLFGLTLGTWATISPKVMGVIFIVTAIIILIDAFWINSYARWTARRGAPVA